MERHVFIALEIPASIKCKLEEVCSKIKNDYSFKTWVHPEDYHITLAFLGKIESGRLDDLKIRLKENVMKLHTFPLEINHFGFFGHEDHPRIFWAGMKSQPDLYELQSKVALSCKEVDIPLEKRPYSPHVTLARKLQEQMSSPFNSNKWWEIYGQSMPFFSEKVVIYETHFEKTPKYKPVDEFLLTR
jgi:RNA 2',3'-cyclic 3'-phosphodiesterase